MFNQSNQIKSMPPRSFRHSLIIFLSLPTTTLKILKWGGNFDVLTGMCQECARTPSIEIRAAFSFIERNTAYVLVILCGDLVLLQPLSCSVSLAQLTMISITFGQTWPKLMGQHAKFIRNSLRTPLPQARLTRSYQHRFGEGVLSTKGNLSLS